MIKRTTTIISIQRLIFLIGLFVFLSSLASCDKSLDSKTPDIPVINFDNGQFDIQAVVLDTNATSSGPNLGSGTLSFRYSGDMSGNFSASGSLVINQNDSSGVAALLSIFEDIELDIFLEGLSLIAFQPTSDGKADVFALNSKVGIGFQSIKTGDIFGIGDLAQFNGALYKGLKISEFWSGDANFLETSEHAFVIADGVISIISRDNNLITGTFFGTTVSN